MDIKKITAIMVAAVVILLIVMNMCDKNESMIFEVSNNESVAIFEEAVSAVEREMGSELTFCGRADVVFIKDLNNKELIDVKGWYFKDNKKDYFTVVVKKYEGWFLTEKVIVFHQII